MSSAASTFAPQRDSDLWGNRRKWIRHECGPEVSCRLILDGANHLRAKQIQNISAGGINLVLERMVPTGKVLTVELHHPQRAFTLKRQARVTYLFRNPEGNFVMGGAFAWELGIEDLENLL